jgi:hypothetical protein
MTAALLLLLSWGGTVAAWSSPTIVGFALGAAALFVLLLARERVAAEPILPLPLFRNRVSLSPLPLSRSTRRRCSAPLSFYRLSSSWCRARAHRMPGC